MSIEIEKIESLTKCPLCKSNNIKLVKEEKWYGEKLKISRCLNCKVAFTSTRFTEEYFNMEYFNKNMMVEEYEMSLMWYNKDTSAFKEVIVDDSWIIQAQVYCEMVNDKLNEVKFYIRV